MDYSCYLADSKFTLREDQEELKGKLHEALFFSDRILFCGATGIGKSVILADLVRDYVSLDKRCLILVHRSVLVEQLSKTFNDSGIYHGIIKAGYPEKLNIPIQIATVQTLNRRNKKEYDLIILDEAHLTTFTKAANYYFDGFYNTIVGFTATPWSLSKKKQLAERYENIVVAPTPKDLMEKGILCYDKYYANYEIDVSKIRIQSGDYRLDDLSEVCNHAEVIEKTVDDWLKFGENRSTACFCVDKKHAIVQKEAFIKRGIPAAIITGETPALERTKILRKLANGSIKIITSIGVLTEGWDYKALGCILLCRPTKSKSLFSQMIGRGLRSHPTKKDCIIIDVANNTTRFGLIRDYQNEDYNLVYRTHKAGIAPVRKCPECNHIQHTAYKICQNLICCYEFPVEEKQPLLNDLIDLDDPKQIYRFMLEQSFVAGYKPSYAFARFKHVYNETPPRGWSLGAIFNNCRITKRQLYDFGTWIYNYCHRYNKPYWQFKMYFLNEFGNNLNEKIVLNLWNEFKLQ